RFPRAGQAGDNDHPVARQIDRDVLQVVDARALHRNRGAGRRLRRGARSLRHGRQLPTAKKASSSTVTGLRFVSCTEVEAFPTRPRSDRYSQAVVTPRMSKFFLK